MSPAPRGVITPWSPHPLCCPPEAPGQWAGHHGWWDMGWTWRQAGRASPLHGVSSHRHTWPISDSQNQGKVALGGIFHVISGRAMERVETGTLQWLRAQTPNPSLWGAPPALSHAHIFSGDRLLSLEGAGQVGCALSSNQSWTLPISKERMIHLFVCSKLPWLYSLLMSLVFICDAFGPQRGWGKWYLCQQASESTYLSPPLRGSPGKSSGQIPFLWAWKSGQSPGHGAR